MKITKLYFIFLFAISLFFNFSCKKNVANYSDDIIILPSDIDYSDSINWAKLPDNPNSKAVDVFYVYPTLFSGENPLNMDINNVEMRSKVQANLKKMASVFYDDCNVYAPYYKQMSLDGLDSVFGERRKDSCLKIGYADVFKAFKEFCKIRNKENPFFLAGHSQGSLNLITLMMDDTSGVKELHDYLIAAYIIGYTVTDSILMEMGDLKIADNATYVGGVVTYNTQADESIQSPVLLNGARCVNPLTWRVDTEFAPDSLNKGAVFFTVDGIPNDTIFNFTDAQCMKNGALVTTEPSIETYSNPSFPEGVYHVYDYSFFYNNLKENIKVRINSYMNRNKKLE